ncbi:GTP-binding protein YchF [Gracilaria domingensis]|nr:GTP-binding protein YchF [Gracilaria domingensis]
MAFSSHSCFVNVISTPIMRMSTGLTCTRRRYSVGQALNWHRSFVPGYAPLRVRQFTRGLRSSRPSMKLNSAIVGLPNVGKSTLFNALVENAAAQAANFPFCTIEPNVGIAVVPDERLHVLGKLSESARVVPATVEVVDVAGLVKGAAEGEGLGNKFLANIRECDAIVHVVRCFEDEDVIHVSGSVDPVRDIETINLELALADMAQVEKRRTKVKSKRGRGEISPFEVSALDKVAVALDEGRAARSVDLAEEELDALKPLGLLTLKPVVYAANVCDEELAGGNPYVDEVRRYAEAERAGVIVVSAQVESELVGLDRSERGEFLEALGVTEDECGLRALVRATYELLGLQTYFTSGKSETKAWTIRRGMKAPQAAGVIHNDFERGFIRAETISYKDLCLCGSEKNAKEKGMMRSEGKEYEVKDGDVMLFRFNV